MSYKNLDVWKLSQQCIIEIHKMTLKLPDYEKYETGAQIRRSSKSVKSNIVEGYGRRFYIKEYIRYLIYAQASNDETIDHLETLYRCGSLTDQDTYDSIFSKLVTLGKKLNRFIKVLRTTSY
jgi:four helix bundle protein